MFPFDILISKFYSNTRVLLTVSAVKESGWSINFKSDLLLNMIFFNLKHFDV